MAEPTNVVYHFTQKVQRLERDDPGAQPVTEEYTREGLLLLVSDRTLTDWQRFATEYESDPKFLAKARAEITYHRDKLAEEHLRLRKGRKLQFGFPGEVPIAAKALNQDPGVDLGPVPSHALGLPTILPSVFVGKPEKDKTWTGVVRVQYGFAEFKIPWTAKLTDIAVDGLGIEVVLDAKEQTVWGLNVVLRLKPEGTWKLTQSLTDFCPVRMEGKYVLSVHSVWAEGDQPKSIEAGRCAVEFSYERVPVKFDGENIYPAAWESQIKHAPPAPGVP
ncbi:MAG: hypothetical protein ACHRHE_20810 [Tepidisphaerales bacterium]